MKKLIEIFPEMKELSKEVYDDFEKNYLVQNYKLMFLKI